MNSLSLVRDVYTDLQTKGQLFVMDENAQILFQCFTVELPWKENQQFISCIPTGRYRVRKRTSNKYGQHLHILDVPGRELILIHEANFYFELLGCIAVGKERLDINGDGQKDVTKSKKTKHQLLSMLPNETEIVIG